MGFIIDIPRDEAVVSSEWSFDAVSTHRTRITQRIVLWGTNAQAYVNDVHVGFRSTLADGMNKIADALGKAQRAAAGSAPE